MQEELSLESLYKAKVIRDINKMLIKHGQDQIDPADFDILYDLDIDELIIAKEEIFTKLSPSYHKT